jgi:hypothetical protein
LKQPIALLEELERPLHVARLLHEPLRIPLAPGHAEEVAAVDVDRAGQAPDRVGDGMNDVLAQRKDLARPPHWNGLDRLLGRLVGRESGPVVIAVRPRIPRVTQV